MTKKTTEIDVGTFRTADWPIESMILKRWSPRAMSGESITDTELMTMLEAARWAPSSYNSQPWRFLYARRGTTHWDTFFNLLGEGNKAWCKHAAVLFVIVTRNFLDAIKQPAVAHMFDAGAAWGNLALQGTKMGLVVHGMQGFDYARAKSALGVPDDFNVCAMVAVGRPGTIEQIPEGAREREKPNSRNPIAAWAFEGRFRAG
ncbi:MAG: nitroreductase [Alphaproteobacteria bacterium]|nr:nitroreductase [Alphaproteobacteria bacterium]